MTIEQVQDLGFTTLYRSRYSPDLGLSDFHLLPQVKEQLTGHHYICQTMQPGQWLPCGSVIKCTNLYNGLTKLLEHW